MYLDDKEKTKSDRRGFFISYYSYFKRVFKSMFNLSLDKKYTLEFLDVFKSNNN